MTSTLSSSSDALLVLSLSVLFLVLRALNVAFRAEERLHHRSDDDDDAKNVQKTPKKLLVVVGSGGHTAEMMTALRSFPETKFTSLFYRREYVLADTDQTSRAKIVRFEEERGDVGECGFHVVPRAREVGQSYFTSAFTTTLAFWSSWKVYAKTKPDAVLTNGPGTCVPVLLACFLGKMFWFNGGCKVMYVESVARTKRMSLSGRLCYSLRLADVVFVMWPELKETYPRAKFCGRIY